MNVRQRKNNDEQTATYTQVHRSVASGVAQNHAQIALAGFNDNRASTITQRALQQSISAGPPVYQLNGKKRKRQDDSTPDPKKKRRLESYYLDKQFSFRLEDDPEKEVYNQHVDDLVDGLDEDRENLRFFIKKDENNIKKYKRKSVSKRISALKRGITEKVGELNASQYMNKNHPSANLIYGYAKGTGFDQVYEDNDRIFVVEAKGPGAKLGQSARKGKQMSTEWVLKTAQGMSNKKVRRKIMTANRSNNLEGIVITSTPKGNTPKKGLYYDYSKKKRRR